MTKAILSNMKYQLDTQKSNMQQLSQLRTDVLQSSYILRAFIRSVVDNEEADEKIVSEMKSLFAKDAHPVIF